MDGKTPESAGGLFHVASYRSEEGFPVYLYTGKTITIKMLLDVSVSAAKGGQISGNFADLSGFIDREKTFLNMQATLHAIHKTLAFPDLMVSSFQVPHPTPHLSFRNHRPRSARGRLQRQDFLHTDVTTCHSCLIIGLFNGCVTVLS